MTRRASILAFALLLVGCGKESWHTATVIAKQFTPSTTGVGPNTGKGGGVTIVTTDEQYTLIVKFPDGAVVSISVSADQWAQFEVGSAIDVDVRWWGVAHYRKPAAQP